METVLKIERVLNMESSRRLKKQLIDLLENGTKHVVLDFADTESIDSSGLGKLLLFNQKFKETGRKFAVSNVRHVEVTTLFRLINLDKIIVIGYKN